MTYGRAALRRELDGLGMASQGTRNDSLNRSAFALGQLVASGALEESATAAALLDAGLRLGLGEQESERTIAAGWARGWSNRGCWSAETLRRAAKTLLPMWPPSTVESVCEVLGRHGHRVDGRRDLPVDGDGPLPDIDPAR